MRPDLMKTDEKLKIVFFTKSQLVALVHPRIIIIFITKDFVRIEEMLKST